MGYRRNWELAGSQREREVEGALIPDLYGSREKIYRGKVCSKILAPLR